MTEKPGNAVTLQYAERPRMAWVSRHRNKLVILALIIALTGSWWAWWPPLRDRALWLYWSDRCASHVMPNPPVDVIVDPANLAAAKANPDFDLSIYSNMNGYSPRALRELAKIDGRLTFTAYSRDIFLGTLHRPDGTPRLVVIGSMDSNAFHILYGMRIAVLPKAGLFDRIPRGSSFGGSSFSGPWRKIRYKTAVVDPNDRSHLTIAFLVDGKERQDAAPAWTSGLLEAYLQNDDTIHFELQDSPQLETLRVALSYDKEGERITATTRPSDHLTNFTPN